MTIFRAAVAPRTVPGGVLRGALGSIALAATLVATLPARPFEAATAIGVLMVLGSIAMALAPGSVLPLAVMIGIVVFRLAWDGPVLDANLLVLVALLPAIHQLSGACAAIPARSACELRTLYPALIRYAIAVVPVECVLGCVLVLS